MLLMLLEKRVVAIFVGESHSMHYLYVGSIWWKSSPVLASEFSVERHHSHSRLRRYSIRSASPLVVNWTYTLSRVAVHQPPNKGANCFDVFIRRRNRHKNRVQLLTDGGEVGFENRRNNGRYYVCSETRSMVPCLFVVWCSEHPVRIIVCSAVWTTN